MKNTELIELLTNLQYAVASSQQSMSVMVPGCSEPQEERIWYIDGDRLHDNITKMIDKYEEL